MHRISGSGATVDGRFKESPAPATRVSADYLNGQQDELTNVVTDPDGGNMALDTGDNRQLLKSIQRIVALAVGVQVAAKLGRYRSTIAAGGSYRVNFGTAFPTGTEYVVSLTDVNASASAARDNWCQLATSDETGFYVVVQGSQTGGNNTLDGFDWRAEPI